MIYTLNVIRFVFFTFYKNIKKNPDAALLIVFHRSKYFRLFALGFLLFILCVLLLSCGEKPSTKFKQYYVHGEQLYLKHCSNCHQADGSGLGRVYPPLNSSDFMENNFDEVICLMRFGKSGELIVNGQQFNQPMQGVSTLSDLEIAEIATYIYNTWSHERGIVEVREVSVILDSCQNRR